MYVSEIWRYPVKSFQGERLDIAKLDQVGIDGDRRWAVADAKSGVSLSAKRYPALLACEAQSDGADVRVSLPDGETYIAGSSAADAALSDYLSRGVVMRHANDTQKIQHEFPTGINDGTGDPFLHEPGVGSFVDSVPLHLLTTASLRKFSQLCPGADFSPARFRPNFIVEAEGAEFAENRWLGKDIRIGSMTLNAFKPMTRCVMVTHGQLHLARDIEILRTVREHNQNNAGIKLRATGCGSIRAGDQVNIDE